VIAFGAGKVTFPEVDPKTNTGQLRVAPSFLRGCAAESGSASYTAESLAAYLKWDTGKDGGASHDLRDALAVLEGMEAETLTREDVDVDVWWR
jgi:hypothetical protein